MPRQSLVALAVFLAVALAVAGAAFSRSSSTPTLKGVVGPGYSIKLTRNGTKVKSLKAGVYRFAISDRSTFHNFTVEREKGGKIERHLTSTGFKGTKTTLMTLKRGSWKYYCSVHEALMFGFFKVT